LLVCFVKRLPLGWGGFFISYNFREAAFGPSSSSGGTAFLLLLLSKGYLWPFVKLRRDGFFIVLISEGAVIGLSSGSEELFYYYLVHN
jgi:hypothetical protein